MSRVINRLPDSLQSEGEEDCLQERARRGSREKYEAALAQVPDAEPDEADRL